MRPFPPGIARRLGLDLNSIRFIRSSQNNVYEFSSGDGSLRILRLTADSHRTRSEIEDELAWVASLHRSDAPVCAAIPWQDDSLIQSLSESEEICHVVQFERAPGRALMREDLSSRLYYLHGKLLGKLHSASRGLGLGFLSRRKSWEMERYFTGDIGTYIPVEVREQIRDSWDVLRAELSCQANPGFSGPIHFDLGYSNFFIEKQRLHAFDFDNCAVGPFVADIAFALYGALFTLLRAEFPGDRDCFAHPRTTENLAGIWTPFQTGYSSESPWLDEWNEQIPVWMECAYFRAVVHAFRMLHPVSDPAIKKVLDEDIANVVKRRPPLRFDFLRD